LRIDDTDLESQLKPTVLRLLGDERSLERMRGRARVLARPDAAKQLAADLSRLALREPGYTA
jgi:UDP-N-acetylglucosamine:LPS N-acetylglucosamine transferase